MVSICEDDDFSAPEGIVQGEYYLGCDLGFARDPSEFVVYKVEVPILVHIMRVHLEGVNYARQMDILVELDQGFDFSGIGIDCGNSGRAVANNLMEQGEIGAKKYAPMNSAVSSSWPLFPKVVSFADGSRNS